MKTLLKVLNEKLKSPYKDFEYEPNRWYTCKDFDDDPARDCSRGFYAVDVEGLPYAYRPNKQIWWCEVDGKEVEYDLIKRRYEKIRITHQADLDEIKQMAVSRERECGYKLSEVLFPFNPLVVFTDEEAMEKIVTPLTLERLREWIAVQDSVEYSVGTSVRICIQDSVGSHVWHSVRGSVGTYVRYSINHFVGDSVWASIWAYISSLFPDIEKWKYIDHELGVNPFQPGIDLWKSGFVPSFYGKKWRLHAGPKATVVWEGK